MAERTGPMEAKMLPLDNAHNLSIQRGLTVNQIFFFFQIFKINTSNININYIFLSSR
jgi:hypothetical protein